ncbi:MAG: hypothetical protein GY861_03955 [bacterium]|nr:hypothetical protein [bacterium]
MDKVYELVFLNFDDMYFSCGLFKTFEEVEAYIKIGIESGESIAWDSDVCDQERLEIIEYSFGTGDNLRKVIKEVTREYVFAGEDDDDGEWKIIEG